MFPIVLWIYHQKCLEINASFSFLIIGCLNSQLLLSPNWQWIHRWSQKQTQSHWTVRFHLFLCLSVTSTLWVEELSKPCLVWSHWQGLSSCWWHIRVYLLRLNWDVITPWKKKILYLQKVTHPPSLYKVNDCCFHLQMLLVKYQHKKSDML